ncbi:MAG: VWA domain-containing protein [Acidobacteria bacterium]|nr:VWA domain-containing protein [Acidobacteriota bacterium]MBV9476379.1 VWA domain-containing protein [Acidobacteriota bacterium]
MRALIQRLFALFLIVPATLFAQQQQQPFQEKVTVTYVEIPVTVVRNNEPVRGLTKENFVVTDDGVRRDIESFDAVDFAAATEPEKRISPLNPASRRNFLLLFDLSYSTPNKVSRAQQAARNFIARSVTERDLVAIGTVDVDHGFRFVTTFTTDRELLTAAIANPRHYRALDPLQIASTDNPLVTESQPQTFGAEGVATQADAGTDAMAEFVRGQTKMDEAYRRLRLTKQVEMLGVVAHSLQKLAGRKHVVLLSEGFDARLVQGRGLGETGVEAAENDAIQNGELWKVDSDQRYGNARAQQAIVKMAEEFRRADAVLHTVDIQGVRVKNDVRSGATNNNNEGLYLLANSTGGSVFRNSNDIGADFDHLTHQQEVVYVLGFQAPVDKPGTFHKLSVKLTGVPSARVQHRGGYYDAGAESTIERSLSTAEIILNDIPQDDIDVAALATSFPTGGTKSQVPVILEISGNDLVKHAKNDLATTEVFVYAFDSDGVVRDRIYERMKLDVSKVGDRLKASGVKFYGTLSLPPGKYAIKSLVHVGETDAKGYKRVNLDVAKDGDVAVVQPLFFQQAAGADWIMVKADSKKPQPYPFVLGGESFVPDARATLRAGEPRLFALYVYNAEPDELTWDIAPTAKLVSQNRPAGGDVTQYVFALENVPHDARELGVTIHKKGSSDERHVTVPIVVR